MFNTNCNPPHVNRNDMIDNIENLQDITGTIIHTRQLDDPVFLHYIIDSISSSLQNNTCIRCGEADCQCGSECSSCGEADCSCNKMYWDTNLWNTNKPKSKINTEPELIYKSLKTSDQQLLNKYISEKRRNLNKDIKKFNTIEAHDIDSESTDSDDDESYDNSYNLKSSTDTDDLSVSDEDIYFLDQTEESTDSGYNSAELFEDHSDSIEEPIESTDSGYNSDELFEDHSDSIEEPIESTDSSDSESESDESGNSTDMDTSPKDSLFGGNNNGNIDSKNFLTQLIHKLSKKSQL